MHLSLLSLCLLKAKGLIKRLVTLYLVRTPQRPKTKPEQNCVLCLCVCFAVEVLRCHRVHRLARGLQREGGSGSLLPGALPELWAELHQYVLEPGEYTTARDVEAHACIFVQCPHMVPLYIKQIYKDKTHLC